MSDDAEGPARRRSRLARLLTGLAVVAAVGWGAVAAWRHFQGGRGADVDLPLPPDPRETTDSPYHNVRPGVPYVGTAACSSCHKGIAARYARHPMGRSSAVEGPGAEMMGTFTAQGFEYSVEKKGKQTVHREVKKDADGTVLYDVARSVSHVVGSGTRGKTYLWESDGRLFESPISWYAETGRWGLSPGYQRRN